MAQSTADSLAAAARTHAPIGAAMGVGASVLSYVLTYALLVVDGLDTSASESWRLVGLVWYSAHNVEVVGRASGAGRTISESANLLADDGWIPVDVGTAVPTVVYYVVPVVALVLAGFATVRVVDARLDSAEAAGVAGATVALGAVVAAVLGRFLFEIALSAFGAQASAAPSLLTAVLLAGLLYPAIFGGLGGVAAR